MSHVRIIDGKPELISVKEALAEINHAMMDGKDDVAEMNASKSSASIRYTDGRHVVIRPATEADIKAAQVEDSSDERVWSTTHSGHIYHRFSDKRTADCRGNIRPRMYTRIHDDWSTLSKVTTREYVTICPRCAAK